MIFASRGENENENVKCFWIDEVVPASEVDSSSEDTRDLVFKFLENKLRILKALVVESSSKDRDSNPPGLIGSLPI